MNNLEQRVAALEKNLRFYRLAFMGVFIVAGGLITMSFNNKKTAPDVIEAKAFHVVDDRGNILVDLSKDGNNGHISTFTPAGRRLVRLMTSDGGAGGINTFGPSGEVLFKLTNTAEGGGYLALFNGESREIAELGVTNSASGYMRLNDRTGNKLVWLTYSENGGGYMSLSKGGQEMMRLSTASSGGRLGIYNSSNTRVIYAGTQDNKDGNITIWNMSGARTGGIPAQ